MSLQLNEHELAHLVEVLKGDLKDRIKRIRMATVQTSDDEIAIRVGRYQKTLQLFNKVETEHKRVQGLEPPTDHIGDDEMFQV